MSLTTECGFLWISLHGHHSQIPLWLVNKGLKTNQANQQTQTTTAQHKSRLRIEYSRFRILNYFLDELIQYPNPVLVGKAKLLKHYGKPIASGPFRSRWGKADGRDCCSKGQVLWQRRHASYVPIDGCDSWKDLKRIYSVGSCGRGRHNWRLVVLLIILCHQKLDRR